MIVFVLPISFFFFFNDTATTEIYTLSLHDALPICRGPFRVFAFGIGYDVNTYLLDRLTERARGLTEYIQPGGDIEHAVGSLATKISSPVLTDLTLRAEGAELYDVQPGSLPDLFAGDELVVFGRYRGAGSPGAEE